jgi:hypothetical protein
MEESLPVVLSHSVVVVCLGNFRTLIPNCTQDSAREWRVLPVLPSEASRPCEVCTPGPWALHLQDDKLVVGPLNDALGLLALLAALPWGLHEFIALRAQIQTRLSLGA